MERKNFNTRINFFSPTFPRFKWVSESSDHMLGQVFSADLDMVLPHTRSFEHPTVERSH